MATLKDAVALTEQLNSLAGQLHGELTEGDVDFEKMVQLADDISEQADGIAAAFTRMNEALTDPLEQQNGDGGNGDRESKGRSSGGRSRASGGNGGGESKGKSEQDEKSDDKEEGDGEG